MIYILWGVRPTKTLLLIIVNIVASAYTQGKVTICLI